MLHRIKLPTYNDALYEFLEYQHKLVIFACTPSLSYPLTQEAVKQYFQGVVGEWFYKKLWPIGKPATKLHGYLKDLVDYVACHGETGQAIIAVYEHDIDFCQHFDDRMFQFHYHTNLDQETQKKVEPLLSYCYTLLSDGFPLQNGTIQKFARYDLIEAFHAANMATLRVCPSCDGQRPIRTKEKNYAQADHFFPRSRYPFLSIHPQNLVPICNVCNTDIKKDIPPIALDGFLCDTFHPYNHPAIEDIEVKILENRQVGILDKKPDPSGKQSPRVKNLHRLFKLEKTWNDQYLFDWRSEYVERLKARGRDARDRDRILSKPEVEQELKEELRDMLLGREAKIGMEKYYVVTSSYVCYALTHEDELNELVREYMGE